MIETELALVCLYTVTKMVRQNDCLQEDNQLPVNFVSGMICIPLNQVNMLNNKWRKQTKNNEKKGRNQELKN